MARRLVTQEDADSRQVLDYNLRAKLFTVSLALIVWETRQPVDA
jgi:hypothetical protein